VHIKQRVPHSALPPYTTPFKLWFCHKPNLTHLRPFGMTCIARIISNNQSKFQPHGEAGHFLGYTKDAKGYLIWVTNPNNNGGTLKVRRDVIFHDFPSPLPSSAVPNDYRPLWENIPFPDRLHHHNSLPYIHAQSNTIMRLIMSTHSCTLTDTGYGRSVETDDPHNNNNPLYIRGWHLTNTCTHLHHPQSLGTVKTSRSLS
jgi:hypothetical protein